MRGLINCSHAEHGEAVRAIFNDAIANTTAVYEYEPRSSERIRAWFEDKANRGLPVLGAVDDRGSLLGFASYGAFRAWPAYKYSVEHSVYVHRDSRGRGLGRHLLGALIEHARGAQLHLMVGGIDAENSASIALHERLGFQHAGTIRQAGFKFGRWLDLAFYQLQLETPLQPVDG
ncbi:MAG TPA: GNAT family N-acetyltransferase [Polyangiaceae bacterium]|nr:GNAT family N-acetyltransferase [Polyangiaceae bacterium]